MQLFLAHPGPVLFGVYLFEVGRARHQRSLDVAEELMERAQQSQDSAAREAGLTMMAVSQVHMGKQPLARRHCEKFLDLHDPDQHHSIAFRYGLDLGTTVSAYYAWALWLLGYPDRALEHGQQTLIFLERIKHPYTESRALYWNSVLHEFRREWPIVFGLMVVAAANGSGLTSRPARISCASSPPPRSSVA